MNSSTIPLKKYVSDLINFYTTNNIKSRGNAILQKNNVSLLSYDVKNDLFTLSVLGNHRYKVYVRGLRNRNAQVSCTCPYTWGMCKHSVAALKFLASQGESIFEKEIDEVIVEKKPTKKIKPVKKITSVNSDFEIKNWGKLDLALVSNSASSFQDIYYADNVLHNISVTKLKYTENLLTLQFENTNLIFLIQFLYKNGKVFITKRAKRARKLNQAETLALMFIALSENPNLLDLFFSKKIELLKKDALQRYGLENEKFEKYFEIGFSLEGLFFVTKDEFDGLLPIKNQEKSEIIKLIHKINTPNNIPTQISTKTSRKKRTLGFVLGAFESYYYNNENSNEETLKILPVIAKMNKAGTQMINSFEIYDEREWDIEDEYEIQLSDNQKKLNQILWKLNEDINVPSPREKYNLQKQLFSLLAEEKFVFIHTVPGKKIRKKDLVPLKVSPVPLTSFFEVSSDEHFIKMKLKLSANEKEINPSTLKKTGINNFFYRLDNVLYTIDQFSVASFINDELQELKMVKNHKENFYSKIIKPLSQNTKIVFRTPEYPHEMRELDFDKKQIFLSEKNGYILITPQVEYQNGLSVALYQTGDVLHEKDGQIIQYIRNFELENNFIDFLGTLHPDFPSQKEEKIFYLSYEAFSKDFWFYKFFDALQNNEVEVYGLKDLKNFKYSPHRGKFSTSVKSGIDWFEVNLEIVFGNNRVNLKDIRQAVLNKNRYILLKDGSVGILPKEWFQKLEKYFRHGNIKADKLEISKLKFSIIDELFDELDDDQIIQEIETKKKKLLSFKEISRTKIPKEIKANLRHYQKEGVNWLNFLDEMGWGGILADDMGLGKTLQVLTFLQQKLKTDKTPNLIIVPTTLLFNWEAEIKKFAPKLKALYHYGPTRATDTKSFKKYSLIFTTYGILLRDIEMLKDFPFNYVILDESQAIKNPASRRFKAAGLLKTRNRLALTGTPIENSTFDLYAQMNFVNPGFFDSISGFKTNFSNPIDKEGNEGIAAELQKMVNPFILRRTKEMVAKELPPKTEDIIYCEMDAAQRDVYDAYRNEYRNRLLGNIQEKGLGKSKMMVLEALTRLRQICDSPLLLNNETINVSDSVKIRELLRHINDKTAHHKILIFSQFVTMIGLIKTELDKYNIDYEYLDGQSSQKQRQQSVNRFQDDPELRVFLISLKAGGTGLNLTAADYVYVVDPWWNPAVENQAIDRCYRIGQDKKVFAYRMICTNTVEEKILQLQQKKKKIANDIVQTDENIMKNLSIQDIQELFS